MSHEIVQSIEVVGIPAINVSQITVPQSPFPRITTNESRVGELAAAHLLERRFKRLGYYGPPHRPHYTDHIFLAYSREAHRQNMPLSIFQPDRYFTTDQTSHDDLLRLGPWLEQLEKPAGILTWNASGAQRVMSACEMVGINVPNEIGVLAGEHDDLMAAISNVSMSSVDHGPSDVGWHAAAALDRVFQSAPLDKVAQWIEPRGIIVGDSTQAVAIRDPVIERATQYIRENMHPALTVHELAGHLGLSRRALEVRFSKNLGRSPGTEIRMVRLEHARKLLTSSTMPIARVAEQAGYRSIEVFSRSFSAKFGTSPRGYRKRHTSTAAT